MAIRVVYTRKLTDYQSIYELMFDLSSEKYIGTVGFTVDKIEDDFTKMPLQVTGRTRVQQIEDLHPPSFIVIFYYYIYNNKNISSQQQFINFYHEINKQWIIYNDEDHIEAFNSRLSRTYTSLISDIHFYLLLKESKKFKRVVYKVKYDLTGKVDVIVQSNNNHWYGLQLRVDTPNSTINYKK